MGLETIAAVALAASIGSQIYSGQQQVSAQKRAAKQQGEAQSAQLSAAQRTEALNAQSEERANRKPPDLATILARAGQLNTKPATMLTGPTGAKQTPLGQ